MIAGDRKKINLTTSSFERMITSDSLYVDKTRFIERFLSEANDVQLVARHRRLGKSLNMDMLKCFLTDKTDYRSLFKGLYIETSHVWDMAHSAPVFYFDFKELDAESYKEQINSQIYKHLSGCLNSDALDGYLKYRYDKLINNLGATTDGLKILTELVYEITGKRSYILIDEYDKLLMDNYNTDKYDEIREFETVLLSSGLKGNQYLEKALLTGVMRISHESMLSGLNNLVTFDVFSDNVYTDDYGLTEGEASELGELTDLDLSELKSWYNGVKINGRAIYNTYSVMSRIRMGNYSCYWGKSGALDIIANLLNDKRKLTIESLLNGESVEVVVDDRISLKRLSADTGDEAFYSLLVQAGYLALDEKLLDKGTVKLSIPNKELLRVWKDFILNSLYSGAVQIRTLFDDTDDLDIFAENVQAFLTDSLSYNDLASYKGEDEARTREQIYHVFTLGILSAYSDVRCRKPLSNRESGNGRYDILAEKPDSNFIFEFKACESKDDLDAKAEEALAQIDLKRYGADIGNSKKLIKIGVAFCGKLCKVKCR